MSKLGLILLAGIITGIAAVFAAVAAGAGFWWGVLAYVIGGDIGLVAAALLLARSERDAPSGQDT